MYTLDFACAIADLKEDYIRKIEESGAIQVKKIRGMKYYDFRDIYILKIASVLKREGVKFSKITNAFDCLKSLKPEKPLSAFTLFHNGKEVLDLTDDPSIIASRYGQIVEKKLLGNTIKAVAIGSELDLTKRQMIEAERFLKLRAKEVKKQSNVHTLSAVRKLLAG